jgi:hypothetical protein
MICFSAESSGHQAVAALSAPYVATRLGPHNLVFLLLYVFFQSAVFGAGLNVVPGNVNVTHPYTLPGCRAPRGLARSSGGLLVLHWSTALGVFGPLILPAELIVVAYVCHDGTARRLMCATASTGSNFKQGLDAPFHCLFPNRYRLDGDAPECANAT